jgi:hypothetical protein
MDSRLAHANFGSLHTTKNAKQLKNPVTLSAYTSYPVYSDGRTLKVSSVLGLFCDQARRRAKKKKQNKRIRNSLHFGFEYNILFCVFHFDDDAISKTVHLNRQYLTQNDTFMFIG